MYHRYNGEDPGTVMRTFKHDGNTYVLIIFMSSDDRVELQNEAGDVLAVFTANCEIQLNGVYVGSIHHGPNSTLVYVFRNAPEKIYDTFAWVIVTEAYFEAELQISKALIDLAREKGCTVPQLYSHLVAQ